jgi:hypothetical protein
MQYLTAAQWIVLDNLLHGWPFKTNLDHYLAAEAYLWLVRNEYIKDGSLTDLGKVATLTHVIRKVGSV